MRKTLFLRALLLSVLLIATRCGSSDDPSPGGNTDDELTSLPADTDGTHVAQVLGSTSAAFGYYVYLPGGYSSNTKSYPLLIFLHGKSERGDGTNSPTVLNKVLNAGVPNLIKNAKWNPKYPMIVVTPQYHGTTGNANNWGAGDPQNLKGFIEYMKEAYRINPNRIYLTGMSHGGNGVFDYISMVADESSYIAAAAPVASYGAGSGFAKCNNTPIWVFVGEDDATNFSTSLNFVTKYNDQSPTPTVDAKFSAYPDTGHDCWTKTYNLSGMNTADPAYDQYSMNLYDWMFQYKRSD